MVTYKVRVLADYEQVDLNLDQLPLSASDATREFEVASLFIDDCPEGTIKCIDTLTGEVLHEFLFEDYCYDWGKICCNSCRSSEYEGFWKEACANAAQGCARDGCLVQSEEIWSCY